MRIRVFANENYKAVFLNGKTMRFLCDHSKPMSKLTYPEFYDVKITNKCNGDCPYCYQDSKIDEPQSDIITKIKKYFEPMNMNQRPFQVAIGGGEPTLHPQFCDIY